MEGDTFYEYFHRIQGVGTFYEYFHWVPPLEQGPNIVVEDGFVESIFIERAPDEEAACWP